MTRALAWTGIATLISLAGAFSFVVTFSTVKWAAFEWRQFRTQDPKQLRVVRDTNNEHVRGRL